MSQKKIKNWLFLANRSNQNSFHSLSNHACFYGQAMPRNGENGLLKEVDLPKNKLRSIKMAIFHE